MTEPALAHSTLDSGVHALAEFVSSGRTPSKLFRVGLVASIVAITVALLTLGGTSVIDTVQTGTIIGAFPFAFVIIIMVVNFVKRLKKRETAQVEAAAAEQPIEEQLTK